MIFPPVIVVSSVLVPVQSDEKTSVAPSQSVTPIESPALWPPRSVSVTRSARSLPTTTFFFVVSVSVAVERRSARCQHAGLASPVHGSPPGVLEASVSETQSFVFSSKVWSPFR